ncbi:hypothetical protein LEMLEM_LOCUS21753 [Lemmus lemmus]
MGGRERRRERRGRRGKRRRKERERRERERLAVVAHSALGTQSSCGS